jgi:F0F1-type ATP synthase membrane subunit b/b'
MKRTSQILMLLCLTAGLALAEGKTADDPNLPIWKWANFLILAGGLGYMMAKFLPPLFAARTLAITKDMTQSQHIRQEAEEMAAEVEQRLEVIEREISCLKTESKTETRVETQRLTEHVSVEISRIQAQAEREIADAGKDARVELQLFAAKLAIDLAAQKIKARMTPTMDDRLIRGFVRDLK